MEKHDATYLKFKTGLLPILVGLTTYSQQFQQAILKCSGKELNFISNMLVWTHHTYPEWVFKRGFNRHLRSGFRFLLVELDVIFDAYISAEYHLQALDGNDLLQEVADPINAAVKNNVLLIMVIHDFFAEAPINQSLQSLTSDVTDIYNSLGSVLPPALDLLDLSPDYLHLASLVRCIVDIRKALLQIISALPTNQMVVQA